MKCRPKRNAGFTLVELMVALLAGTVAVGGVFYLNGVSSRQYNEQLRVSDLQLALRSAMEQVRRDFSRIGYLAAPSTTILTDCSGATVGTTASVMTPRKLEAINILNQGSTSGDSFDADTAKLLNNPSNNTRGDRVLTLGNYATGEAYLADPEFTNESTIVLQRTSEAFRRSFVDPALGAASEEDNGARFEAVFATPRMVRIENNGRVFFRDIESATFAGANGPQVVLAEALPYCFEPTSWTSIAPVQMMRYQLEADGKDDLARLSGGSSAALRGARRTMLVRRELDATESDPQTKPIAGSARVLLDYAVEFAVDVIANTATDDEDRPVWERLQGEAIHTRTPPVPGHRYRSLIVTLSSRAPEADPRLPRGPTRANHDLPLLTFRPYDANLTGTGTSENLLNARVRTLRSEILLQNF